MLKMSVRTVGQHEADSRLTAKSWYYSWLVMKGTREAQEEKKKKKKKRGGGGGAVTGCDEEWCRQNHKHTSERRRERVRERQRETERERVEK